MKFGEMTRAKIVNMVAEALHAHSNELNEAYLKTDDDSPLSISLGVKVKPEGGQNKVDLNISFVLEKCKDSLESWADENQQVLDFPEKGGKGK
jgi:hypothetical protein